MRFCLGKKPSYDHIKFFGCLCYAHNHSRSRDKFDARAIQCIFFGYPHGQKGWKVYDIANQKLFISRGVHFYEEIFPLAQIEGDHGNSLHKAMDHDGVDSHLLQWPISTNPTRMHEDGPIKPIVGHHGRSTYSPPKVPELDPLAPKPKCHAGHGLWARK